jgi:hypothetical protein
MPANIEAMDVNIIFTIPAKFRVPKWKVTELAMGTETTVFEKVKSVWEHKKPLFIRGHLDGKLVGCMMVDVGASVNIMPLVVFKKLRHTEADLKRTNHSLNSFSREPAQAQEIISKELTVGSKTIPIVFFVVDVKGRYNVLLGRDWIHAGECVPSTLHECLIQWVGDQVEMVEADSKVCVAIAVS